MPRNLLMIVRLSPRWSLTRLARLSVRLHTEIRLLPPAHPAAVVRSETAQQRRIELPRVLLNR